jgi:hypothetical protein
LPLHQFKGDGQTLAWPSVSEEADMYRQPDPATLLVYAVLYIIQVVVPVLLFIVFILLAVKATSFLAHALLPDGGLSRRDQVHRHRLENFAAFMTSRSKVFRVLRMKRIETIETISASS